MRVVSILILLPMLFSCAAGPDNLTASVEKELFEQRSWNVAVMDLEYTEVQPGQNGTVFFQSAGADAGKVIASLLANELGRLENVTIIERSRLDTLVDEQTLQLSGLVDEQSAIDVGKVIGADAVVIGNVSDYLSWSSLAVPGATVSFSFRMIDVESGKVISSGSISEWKNLQTAYQIAQQLTRSIVEDMTRN